ncbi:hypothetical protein G7Z17_g10361 [Cylindrodendrum hubeiense]|uniref:Uncharacterized protein n=1 Tax=Cylindrodendrum hubeiense TaxID=595255 RepID=A0A9P5H4Z9_9HYPO|nr:hypothetical protein G7Z17_g10361 [Cylindrodendrum hubeiense]
MHASGKVAIPESLETPEKEESRETDPRPTQTRGCGRLGRRSVWDRVVKVVVMYDVVVLLYDSSPASYSPTYPRGRAGCCGWRPAVACGVAQVAWLRWRAVAGILLASSTRRLVPATGIRTGPDQTPPAEPLKDISRIPSTSTLISRFHSTRHEPFPMPAPQSPTLTASWHDPKVAAEYLEDGQPATTGMRLSQHHILYRPKTRANLASPGGEAIIAICKLHLLLTGQPSTNAHTAKESSSLAAYRQESTADDEILFVCSYRKF